MKKSFGESFRDFVTEWTVTILILLFGTTTLMQAFVVPTSSMDTTVKVGDHMIVDKLSYAPAGSISRHFLPYTPVRRGDIIVFRWPPDPTQNYVKRVIGVPDDHIRIENKEVYINGKKVTEPYIQHIDPNYNPYRDNFPSEYTDTPDSHFADETSRRSEVGRREMLKNHVINGEVVIPKDFYFAMGDNRDNSLDSRYWGFVPRDNIIGKPFFIFWSYNADTKDLVDFTLDHFVDLAQHFFTKTRWERTLRIVHGYPLE